MRQHITAELMREWALRTASTDNRERISFYSDQDGDLCATVWNDQNMWVADDWWTNHSSTAVLDLKQFLRRHSQFTVLTHSELEELAESVMRENERGTIKPFSVYLNYGPDITQGSEAVIPTAELEIHDFVY